MTDPALALPGPDAAGLILRVLLGDAGTDPRGADWDVATGLAVRNGVVLRLAAALRRRGLTLPARLAAQAERARLRADRIFGLVSQLGQACERHGLAHAFLAIAQHYPDAGKGIQLLVDGAAKAPDRAVLDHVPALPRSDRLRNRLAGATTYAVPAFDTTITMHHGRLGSMGEHVDLAQLVLRGRHRARLGFFTAMAPSTEDQMLVQASQWTYGQTSMNLAEAFWTTAALRGGGIRWGTVLGAAEATGLLTALSCHLGYVEQVYRAACGKELLPADLRQRVEPGRWGRLEFKETGYTRPRARISGPVYADQLRSRIASGDWKAAGRLCLLPVLTIAHGLRRLISRRQGG
ncbi:MAG TPA: hypothetical protein VD793_09095 [Gemmatimonadales bacterium]|nr:hypothetical protein [Gemmatimonadales bacterium]